MKNSMGIFLRNKNTIKNIAYGVQKKQLKVRHNFASTSVKYLGEEAIKKFKHTAPQSVRGGKQLFRTEGKKNILMRSAAQINGKELGSVAKRSADYMRGKELSSLINMVSKSKSQLPFLAGAGLMRSTRFSLTSEANNISMSLNGDTTDLSDAGHLSGADDTLKLNPIEVPNYQAQGKKQLNSGAIYQGELVRGNMHGRGKLTFPDNGDVYEGEFYDELYQGEGKLTYANGDSYKGEFVENLPHGKGDYKTAKEEIYTGEFIDGKMQGKGTYYANFDDRWKPEEKHVMYVGNFKDMKFEGEGQMVYQSLNKYNGSWKNGKRDGFGIQEKKNGDSYEGNWKEDLYDGTGDFYDKYDNDAGDNIHIIGIWKEGVLVKQTGE